MASKTSFLQLELPLNGELTDIWDGPLNTNFTKIDAYLADVDTEISEARFSKTSLAEFLAVSHNADGTLKPTGEVAAARSSVVYGDSDLSGDFDLEKRLNLGDREVFDAREGYPSLRASMASRFDTRILSGAKDANGYPTWMGFTGATIQINGSVVPLMMLIDGYRARVRKLSSLSISGGAGVKYIYALFQSSGVVNVDGDSSTPPPSAANGAIGADTNDKLTLFGDATMDFTTEDVQAGDILEVLGGSANAGQYVVRQLSPGGDPAKLQIVGVFPGPTAGGLNYNVIDPLAVTFGFDTVETPAVGKIYLGEADFDGSSVTAVRPRHFGNTFVGEWRAVDVSGGSPTFEEVFNHRLGSDVLDVAVQVSQANDGSQPIEQLSMGTVGSDLSLNFTNTLSFAPGTFNPGSSGATYDPLPSLTGTVASSLSGSPYADRSALAKWNKNQFFVKNPRSGLFYKDYTGAVRQTGFIRVVIQKRA